MAGEQKAIIEEVHRTFLRIAQQCGHQLSRAEITALDQMATQNGYGPTLLGLTTLYTSLRNGARFPSYDEFKKAIGKASGLAEVSDETIAEDTASRILRMITKKGRRWADDFWEMNEDPAFEGDRWAINYVKFHDEQEREIGEVGKAVVQRMGGWHAVCEEGLMASDFKMLRAQLKRLALSVLELARAGRLDRPAPMPTAIAGKSQGNVKQLERADFRSLLSKPEDGKK